MKLMTELSGIDQRLVTWSSSRKRCSRKMDFASLQDMEKRAFYSRNAPKEKVVEDEIFRRGLQCQFEHFIIDPADPLWETRSTKDKKFVITTHMCFHLVGAAAGVLESKFSDLKTLDALLRQTRKHRYDFR
ncbi:uncharacterized protein BYT42DRAFT_609857 [Radiomyces spectabilis]|uniref:uncharacterized protein n=1 Tax=Radiomyces spectabilis TaxID=64574 RepID=UPI00222089D1|nr:uncharacterized protein BYT42DRAFT_609857 [Radiomyces spectabilis]KAI8394112.1 hypothetical protein BYT42DRAFT_609857 [Radiomyces spectabilis]